MNAFLTIIRTLAVLTAICALPATLAAQSGAPPEQRPLSVIATASAGYDTDITTTGGADVGEGADAPHGGASLMMSYSGGTASLSYYTLANTEYRYYNATEPFGAPLASGSAGVGAALSRRVRVTGSLQTSYLPQFQLSLLPPTTSVPVDMPQPTLDYALSSYDVINVQGDGGLLYQLTSRSGISVSYGQSRFSYLGRDETLDTRTVGALFSHNLSRYATLRLGYNEQTGEYAGVGKALGQQTVKRRNIDAGISYSRPLSLSRKTTFSFSTGSTAVDDGSHTYYNLTGGANLNHRVGRSWTLGLAYDRGVGFVGGLNEPMLTDSASLNLNGVMGRRVSVFLGSGYSNGKVGLASESRNYHSIQANARVEVPVTRRLGVFGSYFYYQSEFDDVVVLAGLFPRHLNRHGVRGGLVVKIY